MTKQSAISEQLEGLPKDAYVMQNQEEKLKSIGASEEQVIQKKDMCDFQFSVQGGMDTYLMDKRKQSELISTEYVVDGDGESLDNISQPNHANESPQSYALGENVGDSNQGSKLISGLLDDDEAEELGIITQESEVEFGDMESCHDDDMAEVLEQTWISSSKKKAKKKTGGKVVIATRVSNRIQQDGRSMLEKAMQRAQNRDDVSKGISESNQFLVLNNLSNDYIQEVASALDLDIVNVDTQIEVFKAEEKVRAALAEANYKEYLESVNKRTAPQGEEAIQEYSLNVIDNTARGFAVESNNETVVVAPRKRGRPKKLSK